MLHPFFDWSPVAGHYQMYYHRPRGDSLIRPVYCNISSTKRLLEACRKCLERDGWFIAESLRTFAIYGNFMVLWFIASSALAGRPTETSYALTGSPCTDSPGRRLAVSIAKVLLGSWPWKVLLFSSPSEPGGQIRRRRESFPFPRHPLGPSYILREDKRN